MTVEADTHANPQAEITGPQPWYYDFGESFADELIAGIRPPDRAPVPIKTVDDLFHHARTDIHDVFIEIHMRRYDELAAHGLTLTKDEFEHALRTQEYWRLEDIKHNGASGVWRAVILSTSAETILAARTAHDWVTRMPEEEVNILGYDRAALLAYISLSIAVQSDVDHIYIREMELEDIPGGRDQLPANTSDGSMYIYHAPDKASGTFIKRPFGEVIPRIKSLAGTLRAFMTEFKRINEVIPAGMEGFDSYLHTLADALDSGVTDYIEVDKLWTKVFTEAIELYEQGCPVTVSAPGFPNERGQIMHDLLVGLRAEGSDEERDDAAVLHRIVLSHARAVGLEKEILKTLYVREYFANGSSKPFIASGLAGDGYLVIAVNILDDIAHRNYELFSPLFVRPVSFEQFRLTRRATVPLHEHGHTAPSISNKLLDVIGHTVNSNILDELKADLRSALYFRDAVQAGYFRGHEEAFIQLYLVENLEYMALGWGQKTDTLSTWYGHAGAIEAHALFESGSVRWNGEQLEIVDALRGLDALARLDGIVYGFFWPGDKTQSEVDDFIRVQKKAIREDSRMKKYIAMSRRYVASISPQLDG